LQEDSRKVNTENSEMAPKPKRQRKVRESEFDINADQETNETEFSVKKKSCVKKGGPRSLWTTEMLDDLVDIILIMKDTNKSSFLQIVPLQAMPKYTKKF